MAFCRGKWSIILQYTCTELTAVSIVAQNSATTLDTQQALAEHADQGGAGADKIADQDFATMTMVGAFSGPSVKDATSPSVTGSMVTQSTEIAFASDTSSATRSVSGPSNPNEVSSPSSSSTSSIILSSSPTSYAGTAAILSPGPLHADDTVAQSGSPSRPNQLKHILIIVIPVALSILLVASLITWAIVWYKNRQIRSRRKRRSKETRQHGETDASSSSRIPSRLWRGTGWTVSAPSEPSFGTLSVITKDWKRETYG
ncbi:hypothetical protein BD324DRAFT_610120 [Kockovaella imperatae]|uniref:Uncharacterized protein n=1 Tax=Kockovaella imperatae TaxID=4999 RepID=A0A1Y1UAH7_9TREE|nr:hypothetical protein BD324DRAFT_610120 [Kockovaella imperatae]ORX34554.1 hypothetical protein BD324DRAFT_610120 [Kockovaella imperatae]